MEVPVCIECGRRLAFASALDWPGWCRAGRGEEAALERLVAYAGRYAPVALAAGAPLDPAELRLVVVERVEGNATTDFGAPAIVAEHDRRALDAQAARRLAAVVEACWARFDAVAQGAPAELRKGPRGGGRDRDAVVAHVAAAELAYARKIGIFPRGLGLEAAGEAAAMRTAVTEVLAGARSGEPLGGVRGWPARYAARRIAWHALDHAWEIEDRS